MIRSEIQVNPKKSYSFPIELKSVINSILKIVLSQKLKPGNGVGCLVPFGTTVNNSDLVCFSRREAFHVKPL